jgi:hypothetical protein
MVKKDKRLGKQVNVANPKCLVCGNYTYSSARGFPGVELLFVYECNHCGATWEKIKDGKE